MSVVRAARALLAASALAAALTAAACLGGGEPQPSTPVRVPAATPAATATATAAAPASPTPAATPAPEPTGSATASPTPAPASPPPLAVRLVEAFAGRGFERPVEVGAYPAGPDGADGPGMFVAEQDGRVLVLDAGSGASALLLDIRERVSRRGNEEGLLSVALDPDFAANGWLWVYYSASGGPRMTRLSRFTVDADGPPRADPASELVILEVGQPFSNHNGGAVRFGPDGMLYLGLGDGGSAGDPRGHGQNLATLLGSIIRIDVRDASEAAPYAVPADNPFVGVEGARPEIWAYGLRNPWRMAFDPETGELWTGDVGQDAAEEIDVIERGGNHGWRVLEGTRCFEPREGCARAGMTPPVAEYGHHLGCSVTGGVVYRGEAVPALAGHYLFADFCSSRVWALPPGGGDAVEIAVSPRPVSSFGEDAAGEVYVLTFGGAALRIEAP